jgi:hypothetical protein
MNFPPDAPPSDGGNKQSRDWWRKRKLAIMKTPAAPPSPPYNGGNKQSQCQRRLSRHRHLELMEAAALGTGAPSSPSTPKIGENEQSQYEAAASGTAPSMELDDDDFSFAETDGSYHSLAETDGSDLISRNGVVSDPQRQSITEEHPNLDPSNAAENRTSTTSIFEKRPYDGNASLINLMDHRTAIYK